MNGHIDPHSAALYAIIAICFVLVGALITPGTLSVEQRGPVLAGIITVLLAIGWREHRRRRRIREDDGIGWYAPVNPLQRSC